MIVATPRQHATAVRHAILQARHNNSAWLHSERMQLATTPGASADSVVAMGVATGTHINTHVPHTDTRAEYHTVSTQDILLGLRINNKLVLVDSDRNKDSLIVRAVDAILIRARKLALADPTTAVNIETAVDGSPNTAVSLVATPTPKGIETVLYYTQNGKVSTIDPIGVVSWFLQ